jgi:hypothetical protein
MIDGEPLLVLPLVHHLVEQRVERLLPAITPNVPSAQNDLRLMAVRRRTVVTEPTLHSTRHPNRHLAECPAEPLFIVRRVPARQLVNDREVGRMGSLRRASSARRIRRPRHRKLENRSARVVPHHSIPAMHEDDNRLPHILAGAEEAVVNPELASAVADDDGAVRREPYAILRAESQPLQSRPQLIRVARRLFLQLESELGAVSQARPHTLIA